MCAYLDALFTMPPPADKDSAAAGRWDEKELRAAQARRDALLQEEELLRRRTSRSTRAGDAGASLHTVIEDLTNALTTNAARCVTGRARVQ